MSELFPRPHTDLRNAAAIVGVGNSDYGYDYETSRIRSERPCHDLTARLANTALERALHDAGLARRDIDGVGFCYFLNDANLVDAVQAADALGLRPCVSKVMTPIMLGVVPEAVCELVNRNVDTFALIYSAPMRSIRQVFGGDSQGAGPMSYWYYHPWGWSSQAAHWALTAQHYLAKYGLREEDLGIVAMSLRVNAGHNEYAVMRTALTMDDYIASRYVVQPLRLLDICLVTDVAVCLILRRCGESLDLAQIPVQVTGWGGAEAQGDRLRALVVDGLESEYKEASRQALAMAGMQLSNIGHFEGYDASSIHLLNQIEGYGFVPRGDALGLWRDGYMTSRGVLPVNTGGGMLSEVYGQGWNLVVEAVRQLRHSAGPRQVRDLTASMVSLSTTDGAYPLILTRGDA